MTQTESKSPPPRLSLEGCRRVMHDALDKHVVVIGDVMLDEFVAGAVDRISPEAPVQVLSVEETRRYAGAAANVANNLAPYVGRVSLVGLTGDDDERAILLRLLGELCIDATGLVADAARPTTVKTRFVSNGIQLLRADRERIGPPSDAARDTMLGRLDAALAEADIALAVDYNKGVLTPEIFAAVAERCAAHGVPLLVDPKQRDLSLYKGATLIKPNRKESEESAGFAIATYEDAERAATLFLEQTGAEAALITLGSLGMMLCRRGAAPVALPTEAREVFDQAGAGDTTMAFLALGLVAGLDYPEAAALGNTAAGITVSKRGVVRVEPFELLRAYADREGRGAGASAKLVAREQAAALGQQHRDAGRRVVFTNGCFDLLHGGHIELLQHAAALGDALIVGLNDDDSVHRLRGRGRPFLKLAERVGILSAFEFVDHVVVFGEDEPSALIAELRPDVLAKGGNYTEGEVVGADIVASYGGRTELIVLDHEGSISQLGREIARRLSSS